MRTAENAKPNRITWSQRLRLTRSQRRRRGYPRPLGEGYGEGGVRARPPKTVGVAVALPPLAGLQNVTIDSQLETPRGFGLGAFFYRDGVTAGLSGSGGRRRMLDKPGVAHAEPVTGTFISCLLPPRGLLQ